MVISIVASAKLISVLAKDMVQSEVAKSLVENLLTTGRRILSNSIQNVDSSARPKTQQGKHPESTEYLVYNWLEELFTWFQMIILWHDPYQSVFALSGLFSSFLLLTYVAPRFYATVLIAIFVYNFTKVWFKHVWPEIRVKPSLEAELESQMDVDRFSHLHPHLMNLTYVGNSLSGLNLLILSVTGLVSAPGIYLYLLPAPVKRYLNETCIVEIFHKAIQESRDEHHHNQTLDTIDQPEPTKVVPTEKPKTLFDNLMSMAYQSNSTTPSQERNHVDDREEDNDDDDDDDDQHGFVIL